MFDLLWNNSRRKIILILCMLNIYFALGSGIVFFSSFCFWQFCKIRACFQLFQPIQYWNASIVTVASLISVDCIMETVRLMVFILSTQVCCRTYPAQTQAQAFPATQTTPPTIAQTANASYNPFDILLLHQRILNALSNSISSLLRTQVYTQPNLNQPPTYGPPNGAALFNPSNANILQPGNEFINFQQLTFPPNNLHFG